VPSDQIVVLWVLLAAMFVIASVVIAFVVSVIVGQRKSIREITKSERKFRYLFENSIVGMVRFDAATGRVIETNEALLKMLGTRSLETIPSRLGLFEAGIPTPLLQGLEKTKSIQGHEILLQGKRQKPAWLSLFGVLNESDGTCEAVVADITQQKQAILLLRQLSSKIIEAEENERRRVARELHDGVNQTLALAKGKLSFVEHRISPAQRKIKVTSKDAGRLVESAMEDVRRISRNLRPSILDDLGFLPAVRALIDELQNRSKIVIRLALEEKPKNLPRHIELALYRLIQESLTNVEKHSRAASAVVRISRTDATVRVEIADNGIGLHGNPRRKKARSGGMGIQGMRERMVVLGGTFHASSTTSGGTVIIAEVPFRQQSGDDHVRH